MKTVLCIIMAISAVCIALATTPEKEYSLKRVYFVLFMTFILFASMFGLMIYN